MPHILNAIKRTKNDKLELIRSLYILLDTPLHLPLMHGLGAHSCLLSVKMLEKTATVNQQNVIYNFQVF